MPANGKPSAKPRRTRKVKNKPQPALPKNLPAIGSDTLLQQPPSPPSSAIQQNPSASPVLDQTLFNDPRALAKETLKAETDAMDGVPLENGCPTGTCLKITSFPSPQLTDRTQQHQPRQATSQIIERTLIIKHHLVPTSTTPSKGSHCQLLTHSVSAKSGRLMTTRRVPQLPFPTLEVRTIPGILVH